MAKILKGYETRWLKLRSVPEKLCKDCTKLVAKFKPRDHSKVPARTLTQSVECKKCNMYYMIYNGMISLVPFITKEEEKEMRKQYGERWHA